MDEKQSFNGSPTTNIGNIGSGSGVLGCFGRYLSLWVLLSMIGGGVIGNQWPSVADALANATIAEVSVPVGVLIWLMVYPMTLRIDIASLYQVRSHPRAIITTTLLNWVLQPLSMFSLALLFFRVIYASTLTTEQSNQVMKLALFLLSVVLTCSGLMLYST
jgi:ACR3 family arsenite transporter